MCNVKSFLLDSRTSFFLNGRVTGATTRPGLNAVFLEETNPEGGAFFPERLYLVELVALGVVRLLEVVRCDVSRDHRVGEAVHRLRAARLVPFPAEAEGRLERVRRYVRDIGVAGRQVLRRLKAALGKLALGEFLARV